MTDSTEYQALFDHMHAAFEAALVSCMTYFRGVWDDKDREIDALKSRLADSETEIARLKNGIRMASKSTASGGKVTDRDGH